MVGPKVTKLSEILGVEVYVYVCVYLYASIIVLFLFDFPYRNWTYQLLLVTCNRWYCPKRKYLQIILHHSLSRGSQIVENNLSASKIMHSYSENGSLNHSCERQNVDSWNKWFYLHNHCIFHQKNICRAHNTEKLKVCRNSPQSFQESLEENWKIHVQKFQIFYNSCTKSKMYVSCKQNFQI